MIASNLICPPHMPLERGMSRHYVQEIKEQLWQDEDRQQAMAAFERACANGAPHIERSGKLRLAMRYTPHGSASNAFEHGADVMLRFKELADLLASNQPIDQCGAHAQSLPTWLLEHGPALMKLALQAADMCVMEEYLVNHDCGKPATMYRDEYGRPHFPGHAQASSTLWARAGGSEAACRLMALDMVLHTANAEEARAFAQSEPLAPALLLAAWCEIESNAQSVFGGVNATSYKIKCKALGRRARAIVQTTTAQSLKVYTASQC